MGDRNEIGKPTISPESGKYYCTNVKSRRNMARSKTSTFTIELPLKVTAEITHEIDKRIKVAINLYNTAVNYSLKKLRGVLADKEYRELLKEPSSTKKNKRLREIERNYGYSEFQLHAAIIPSREHFKQYIGGMQTQALCSRAFLAVEKFHYKKAKKVYFVPLTADEFSIEGKTNATGIKFRDGKIVWLGLEIPVKIDPKNEYIQEALQNRIKYCRIKRKYIREKYKYYVDIVLEGIPPQKNRKVGKVTSTVGLDIGPSTIAIVSDEYVGLRDLSNDKAENYQREITRLQRAMDRSRRDTNPDNYNADGTVKKGCKEWKYSNNYQKLKKKLNKIHRKLKVKRREHHEILANEILSLGLDIRVEALNIQGWKKRAKETTYNKKNGRANSKKRFGKSIINNAPAMLLEILDRKLKYHGMSLKKINTTTCKASQYNHIDDTYVKKALSERAAVVGDNIIQRDIYSAFLIKNTNDSLDIIDRDKCNKDWNGFLENYNNYLAA